MSKFHKIVKYFAVGFATLIIGSIISLVMYIVVVLGNVFSDEKGTFNNLEKLEISGANYAVLDVELESSNVIIKEGSSFKIESNDKYIRAKENNNKLIIEEKKHNWFTDKEVSDLIIYVPFTHVFSRVSIESGAGKVSIESLSTNELDLDLGAGKVSISNLNVLEKTEIDGGAGEIVLKDSKINNLKLDMGVGNLKIQAKILGSSKINSGIGKLDVVLLGNLSDYRIKANKGIGKFNVSGVNASDDTYYGSGSNFIDIDGGIGEITVDFK